MGAILFGIAITLVFFGSLFFKNKIVAITFPIIVLMIGLMVMGEVWAI